jgi:hypothetical protein
MQAFSSRLKSNSSTSSSVIPPTVAASSPQDVAELQRRIEMRERQRTKTLRVRSSLVVITCIFQILLAIGFLIGFRRRGAFWWVVT